MEKGKTANILILGLQRGLASIIKSTLKRDMAGRVCTLHRVEERHMLDGSGSFDVLICDASLEQERPIRRLIKTLQHEGVLAHNVSLILLSSTCDNRQLYQIKRIQPDDVLLIPFTPGELLKRVNRAIKIKAKKSSLATTSAA